jgi:uncharacterized protein YdaU (DUF1376 family)
LFEFVTGGGMARVRVPAFQFYPKDFLSDEKQVAMSLPEVGAYIRLICVCWNEGSLPADLRKLAKLCGATPSAMKKMWPAIGVCFRPHPTELGRIVHPRLERERGIQANFREKQAGNGRKGGRPQKPMGFSGLTQTEPKKSSAIFDLRSAIEDQIKSTAAVASGFPQAVENFRPPDDGTPGQYTRLAHEAIERSLSDDGSDSLSNITEHFKSLCGARGFAYDGITARKAIDAALVQTQKRAVTA